MRCPVSLRLWVSDLDYGCHLHRGGQSSGVNSFDGLDACLRNKLLLCSIIVLSAWERAGSKDTLFGVLVAGSPEEHLHITGQLTSCTHRA